MRVNLTPAPHHLLHQLDTAQETGVVVRLFHMDKLNVVLVKHLYQHGLELTPVHGAAQLRMPSATHGVLFSSRITGQSGIRQSAPAQTGARAPRTFAERLRGDEIGINKGDFIGVFHREINVLGMTERDFIVVGILQRHLVAAKV